MRAKISVFFLIVISTAIIISPLLYKKTIASNYVSPKQQWDVNDVITFEFENPYTESVNINIFIRINEDYDSYSNLFLFTHLIDKKSNQPLSVDTLEYEIYDQFGQCLGLGPSNIKTFNQDYKIDYPLKNGHYELSIEHGMRIAFLTGIEDIGFKITK
jgi:gliding motility-associated lipoprotein GldH